MEKTLTIEQQYLALLAEIIESGTHKGDRTGTGTRSLFGRQLRHRMSNGFPLLTTKHVSLRNVATELIWFLRGRTDLRWLLNRNCHIWVGDAYKKYRQYAGSLEEPDYSVHVDDPRESRIRLMTRQEFIDEILRNDWFSGRFGDLGPVYGKQWRSWQVELEHADGVSYYKYPPIDQVENLIRDLRENPDSRRMMVTAWNPSQIESMVLPPCHYGFQLWTRELTINERIDHWFKHCKPNRDVVDSVDAMSESERLKYLSHIPTRTVSLLWTQRSVDTPLGLPYNIASYALLLELIGREVGMIPDELICSLGDCHVYEDQVELARTQLQREPYHLPSLHIDERYEYYGGKRELSFSEKVDQLEPEWFTTVNYDHHPRINYPLSN
jgi:thymidylate synthase